MRKVFISLFSLVLLAITPSLVQAEGLERSAGPIETITKDLSVSHSFHQDSTVQSEKTSLEKLSQLTNDVMTDVQERIKGDDDSSDSSNASDDLQSSNELMESDANLGVSEDPAIQSSDESTVVDDTTQISEVSNEQTDLEDNGNVSVSEELSELKQNTVLSSLLGEENDDRSLLSIDVQALTNEDADQTQQTDQGGSLLEVNVGLPIIGDVNLDLLSGTIPSSHTGETFETQGELLGVEITNSALLGDINLDLHTGTTSSSLTGEPFETQDSLLGVEITDSTLLGDVSLDVLTGNLQDLNSISGGLVTLDANHLLGQMHVGVLEGAKSTIEDITSIQGGLLLADLTGTLLGDTHLGVAENEVVKTDEYTWNHGGLVIVDTKNTPVLGNVHTGVLEYENYVTHKQTTKPQPINTVNPGNTTKTTTNQEEVTQETIKSEDPVKANDTKHPEEPTNTKEQTQVPCNTTTNNEDNSKDSDNLVATPLSNKVNSIQPVDLSDQTIENTLPKTGSAMDSTILLLVALMTMVAGVTIRRFN